MSIRSKIAVIGFMRFHPDKVADLQEHLRALLEASQKEEGCIAYWVGVDVQDPGVLRVSELWADAEALRQHVKAPHIEPWHNAQKRYGMLESLHHVIDIAKQRTV